MDRPLHKMISSLLVASLITLAIFQNAPLSMAIGSLTFTPEADAYVVSYLADFNFGASSDLKVDNSRGILSYLRFNLSSMPDNIQIIEAKLFIYLKTKSSEITSKISVHITMNNDWDELRISWSNRPNQTVSIYTNDTVAFPDTWQSWDVTVAIANKSSEIMTLALIGIDASGENIFASKDSTNKPYLEVLYTSELEDLIPPEIYAIAISPIYPSSEEDVTASAFVEDEGSGTDIVKIGYRVDGADWRIINVIEQGALYTGVIPRQRSDTIVEYYITAIDKAGNNSTSTIQQYNVDRPDYYYSLLSEYNSMQALYNELMIKYQDVQLQADLIRINYDSLSENFTKLQISFETMRSSYVELKSVFDILQEDLRKLQIEAEQSDLNVSNANLLASRLQEKLDKAQIEMENVELELAKSEGELIGTIDHLEWLQFELNSTRAELTRVRSELNNTQTALLKAETEYSKVKENLVQWQILVAATVCSISILLFFLKKYPRRQ